MLFFTHMDASSHSSNPLKKPNLTSFYGKSLTVRYAIFVFVIILISFFIYILLFLTPTSLFSKQDTKNTTYYTGPIERIRIGNVGIYTIFNLIAQEQGFFKENGLDAEITELTSGPESIDKMLANETDVTIAADFVGVRNIFNHPEIRILAQVNQHRIFQLAGKKNKLSRPPDLKDKKIGVTKNSAGEYFLGIFLQANNLKLEDITLVDLTPAQMIDQVENDTIDAMVVFEPHVYNLQKRLGNNFIAWNVQGNQNISAILYTTQDFIDKNPDVIKRYLRALVQSENYYKTHVEQTKDMVTTMFSYEKEYMDYSWPKLTHHITLNQELLLSMEDQARWTIENKLTDKTTVPNYLEFIYLEGLSSVKPEAITIIH